MTWRHGGMYQVFVQGANMALTPPRLASEFGGERGGWSCMGSR